MKTSSYIIIGFFAFLITALVALHFDSKSYEKEYKALAQERLRKQNELEAFVYKLERSAADDNNKKRWDEFMESVKKYYNDDREVDVQLINKWTWHIHEDYGLFNDTLAIKFAEKWAKKALDKDPENHFVNDTYGCIMNDLGRYEEAVLYESKALKNGAAAKHRFEEYYRIRLNRFKKSLEEQKEQQLNHN